MGERIQFLDGFRALTLQDVADAIGHLAFLPQTPLASHGDHLFEHDQTRLDQPSLPFADAGWDANGEFRRA